MLTPEMIMDEVHYGQELEAKGELFLAYWVYWYAETSFDREDDAMCLIGTPGDFLEAQLEAGWNRHRVWKLLTEEEKNYARQGVNPFSLLPKYEGQKTPPYDFGDDSPGCYFRDDEEDRREMARKDGKSDREPFLFRIFLYIIILLFFPWKPWKHDRD